jgi:hypothetical protein
VSTAGYVKLLLPPRQSRGNSHWGLVGAANAPQETGISAIVERSHVHIGLHQDRQRACPLVSA